MGVDAPFRSQFPGWHALETRGTSVEGRGLEVVLCLDHMLFTNVPAPSDVQFEVKHHALH